MPRTSSYPTILWNANNKRLIHKFFNILDETPSIQRGLWPRRGEPVTGSTKVIHRKNLAKKLLGSDPRFALHVNNLKGLSHYEKAVKSQIARLEKSWKEAKNTLGVTGAGLPNEDAIWDTGPVREKWEEVKEICPWFYWMRDMVEDRFDDVGAAITNSETDVALDATQGGDRRRHHQDTEMENGNDDDENAAEGEKEESQVINPTPTTAAERVLSKASSQAAFGSSPSQSALPPSTLEGSARQKPTVINDLTDEMRQSAIVKNERKRLRDVGVQETKRLESKEVEETKRLESKEVTKRLEKQQEAEDRRQEREENIQMRRLALEERKIALQEAQMGHVTRETSVNWQPLMPNLTAGRVDHADTHMDDGDGDLDGSRDIGKDLYTDWVNK